MLTHLSTNCIMEYDDVGTGPVVLLLHAFPLSKDMWQPQVEALKATHRLITPNQRGFGSTQAFASAPSVDQAADDAAALLDALKIREPVVVGGLSMGGYVAMAFARRHANRLRGLILADTRADADTPEAKNNREKTIAFMQGHSTRDLIEQMLPKLLGQQTIANQPDVVERVRQIASEQSPAAVIAALQALRDRPDANAGLGKIDVPVLVLVGADDVLTPPSDALALASRIKRATLVPVSGAGHLANLEQPGAFSETLQAWLLQIPPDARPG
jgi:pimeloyl-ACP methyl ester carboxylesterase